MVDKKVLSNLQVIHKLSSLLSNQRKQTMIDFFSYKTNKIQILFENMSNPLNAHACLRTCMNFGINKIHIVQGYDNILTNSFTVDQNKTNAGTLKWMDVKMYNSTKECFAEIEKTSNPFYVCTNLSKESKSIMDLSSMIGEFIPKFNKEDYEKGRGILECLLRKKVFSKDEMKFWVKEKESTKTTEEILDELYSQGKFIQDLPNQTKKQNTVCIIFGNESRGASPFAIRQSDCQVMIPHFGHSDTSYNLSVSCGMVLFYLYSNNFLPGTFKDLTQQEATEMLVKKLLASISMKMKTELRKEINKYLSDY